MFDIFEMVQYGALRRKIGGTYKDFFKSYVEGKFLRTIHLEVMMVLFVMNI